MMDASSQPVTPSSASPHPKLHWTALTDAPLVGLKLAREPGRIAAWDESNAIYVFDCWGERLRVARAPGPIALGAFSDDGSLLALIGSDHRLWLFDANLELRVDREISSDRLSVAVDSHGRFVAVAARSARTRLFTRHGRQAGEFETLQPLAHLVFVPAAPRIIAAAGHGSLFGLDLEDAGRGQLVVEEAWRESLLSNVGRLETTGDGGVILASCYLHGLQRFDARGRAEGSYHLGGTAVHGAPDFLGRTLVAATQEGELFVMNRSGNIRWRSGLPRAPQALEIDALGRWFVYGLPSGEISRIDLEHSSRPAPARSEVTGTGAKPASRSQPEDPITIRQPAWKVQAVESEEKALSAVLTVLDDPPRIGLMTSDDRLEVFNLEGRRLGKAPPLRGVGRLLRSADGWIAASTDRLMLVYDARSGTARILEDLYLVQLTHLQLEPARHGLAIVQERDRVGRATLAGRWMWRKGVDSGVEDLAIGPDRLTGLSTDDGRLRILDPAGNPVGDDRRDYGEPLALIGRPESAPEPLAFITLSRHAQVLRGHDRGGAILWETPVPWVSWQLECVGRWAVVSSAQGQLLTYDGAGRATGPRRDIPGQGRLFPTPDGSIRHLSSTGPNLICAQVGGQVVWRAIAEKRIGPIAATRAGVVALFGRDLVFFPQSTDPKT